MNKLKQMLVEEGGHENDTFLDKEDTITHVMVENKKPIGFFTVGMLRNLPILRHFVIDKKYRSPSNARKLGKQFCLFCKANGFTHAHINVSKKYLKRVIEYYFKIQSYTTFNGSDWYFVRIP